MATHPNRAHGFQHMSHRLHETNTYCGKFNLKTTHNKEPKIEGIPTTQHHLNHHNQIVINEAFAIEGHTGQVTGFIVLIHVNIPIMSFIPLTLMLATKSAITCQGNCLQVQFAIMCNDTTNHSTDISIHRNI